MDHLPTPDALVPMIIGLGVALAVFAAAMTFKRSRRDPQRFFSYTQKRALYDQARDQCEHKYPLWRRCHARGKEADHVMPWSRGGRTMLGNGQILCKKHNRRKSNHIPTPVYRWRLSRRRLNY